MTREEAIEYFKMKVSAREAIGNDIGTDYEAYKIALTALRPVSREQVEKAWKGEWTQGGYACGEHEWECSKCHETEWRTSCSRLKFCPFCGAPMTDEAVDMMLERWKEAVDGE